MFIKGCHCCESCDQCFVDFSGSYDFEFTGTCNGNPVTISGTLVDGYFYGVDGSVTLTCTELAPCSGPTTVEGMWISVSDFNCSWEAVVAGSAFTACPSDQIVPSGSYTLENCDDATTGTLVID